jgi:hypothetical protein
MSIFNLFVGKKDSSAGTATKDRELAEEAVKEKTAKDKFMELHRIYDSSYAQATVHTGVASRSEKGLRFLMNLAARLPKDFKHKDSVEFVLNSETLMKQIIDQFVIMENSMKQPTPRNLKYFEAAKDKIKNMVDENFIIAQRVSRYLLKNDDFCKALVDVTKDTRSTFSNTQSSSVLTFFQNYYKLSMATHAYWDEVVKEGSMIDWKGQSVSRGMAPSKN